MSLSSRDCAQIAISPEIAISPQSERCCSCDGTPQGIRRGGAARGDGAAVHRLVACVPTGTPPVVRGGARPVGVVRHVAAGRTNGAGDATVRPVCRCGTGIVGARCGRRARRSAPTASSHASPAPDRPAGVRETEVRPRSTSAACACGRTAFGSCDRGGLFDPARRPPPPVGGLDARRGSGAAGGPSVVPCRAPASPLGLQRRFAHPAGAWLSSLRMADVPRPRTAGQRPRG